MHLRLLSLLICVTLAAGSAAAQTPTRPAIGETVTTASGLKYRFTKMGTGPAPQTGALLIMHGIGTLADGKEFWNTRTDNDPFEYLLGVDSVIKGFAEGMREVRKGDRVIITMTPELGYGARGSGDNIPPNSTLVFDYEILDIKPLTIAKVLVDGFATGTVDEAIAAATALPNRSAYFVNVATIQSAARAANRKLAGEGEKILAFGMTLLPESYELPQALARAQERRNAVADAIKNYETALKLNPKKTPGEVDAATAATTALAALRKK